MERELAQVEQARAVAAVQQEAHRIASRLDDAVASQHSEQAARTAAEEQVGIAGAGGARQAYGRACVF